MSEKILYIEATSGVAGDMLLGAFLDAGVPVQVLANTWDRLGIDNYQAEIFQTYKSGVRALQCRIITDETNGIRTWKEYERLLTRSKLPESFRHRALELMKQLFEIEAALHGSTLEKIHVHEMGGTDLLLDVTGCLSCVDYLKPDIIRCSPVNTGKGFLKFSHGTFAIPTPATTKLLEGLPIFQSEVEGELTTPTGALMVRALAGGFGEMPIMTLTGSGVGAGEKEIEGHPNVVRVFTGTRAGTEEDEIVLIETNVDDSSPQVLSYFMERAFEAGALDVFFTPIFMKKNRPAVRISILVSRTIMDHLMHLLFTETTAIGLRYWRVDRRTLDRKWATVRIDKQEIRIKESYLNGKLANYQPEFEDCKKAAAQLKRPVKYVMAQAIRKYLSGK